MLNIRPCRKQLFGQNRLTAKDLDFGQRFCPRLMMCMSTQFCVAGCSGTGSLNTFMSTRAHPLRWLNSLIDRTKVRYISWILKHDKISYWTKTVKGSHSIYSYYIYNANCNNITSSIMSQLYMITNHNIIANCHTIT